jgi:hypothetical protein
MGRFFPEDGFREQMMIYDLPNADLIANLNRFQTKVKSIFSHPYTWIPIYRPWSYLLLCLF